ncbi:MAG: hypothetical protein IIB37_02905 [Gemmatimonadetes bacterium]|nr:hypothetical protein [Gemmatimonadota bacterium]
MTSDNLENLVGIGQLTKEPPSADELAGLRRSGESRLSDAERTDLSFESRFDLAYNAAHALALYALRRLGYRPKNRYVVFQALPHTVGLKTGHWRVLAKAHATRNTAEYEGYLEQDELLLADMIAATRALVDTLPEGGSEP